MRRAQFRTTSPRATYRATFRRCATSTSSSAWRATICRRSPPRSGPMAHRTSTSATWASPTRIRCMSSRSSAPGAPGFWAWTWAAEPQRRAKLEQAIATGQAMLSPRMNLRLGTDGRRAGFVLYLPVFRQGTHPATPSQRQAALAGLVFAPILIADVLDDLARGEAGQLAFELVDPGAGNAADRQIYDSGSALGPATDPAADQHRAGRFQATRVLALPGRDMTLHLNSGPDLERRMERWIPALVLAIGLLLSALAATWVHRQGQARRQAERLARDMTAELEKLALVARRTSNGVVITDEHRLITWVNRPLRST
ncbi:MAG: CHASE domain-containing protein [Rubrivivax sp.]|nr:CHASE domain-containing protein [Rubrivivax sp.]